MSRGRETTPHTYIPRISSVDLYGETRREARVIHTRVCRRRKSTRGVGCRGVINGENRKKQEESEEHQSHSVEGSISLKLREEKTFVSSLLLFSVPMCLSVDCCASVVYCAQEKKRNETEREKATFCFVLSLIGGSRVNDGWKDDDDKTEEWTGWGHLCRFLLLFESFLSFLSYFFSFFPFLSQPNFVDEICPYVLKKQLSFSEERSLERPYGLQIHLFFYHAYSRKTADLKTIRRKTSKKKYTDRQTPSCVERRHRIERKRETVKQAGDSSSSFFWFNSLGWWAPLLHLEHQTYTFNVQQRGCLVVETQETKKRKAFVCFHGLQQEDWRRQDERIDVPVGKLLLSGGKKQRERRKQRSFARRECVNAFFSSQLLSVRSLTCGGKEKGVPLLTREAKRSRK